MLIKVEQIKKALLDRNFRKMYPELDKECMDYIRNPDCKCNIPLYRAILSDVVRLKSYFGPDVEVESLEEEEVQPEQVNHWQVINCKIGELEGILQGLSNGPKQLAICRWEDEVTVVVNDPVFN
jgi:hypothetical protein